MIGVVERPAPDTAAPERRSVTYRPPDAEGVAWIVIDRPDDKVNAIDVRMGEELAAAIAAARDAAPKGLVVASGKQGHFSGGADLTLVRSASAEDLERASRGMQQLFDSLAALPFPTCAAISGSALAGGCELALACDWRVAADAPSVRIGLSEVQLGVIPGAGGTQRLPRLVGLPRALDLILSSRRLAARRALRAGLVDEVVHPAVLRRAAADRVLRHGKREVRGGATLVERAMTWVPPLRALALSRARSAAAKETRGHYPAPFRAIDAIATGLSRGMTAGHDAEARAFGELATSDTARNLIALLLATLHQRGAATSGLGAPREVAQVGVVGAGFMGSGIAQAAAAAGLHVRMRDVDAAAVARGMSSVRRLTQDAVAKRVFDRREGAKIVGRVSGAPDLSGFGVADIVIEAAFEDIAVKRKVVEELERVIRDDAVIASNTSALPIGEIAKGARRPERVVGMHFFSPVHRMPLVEVVRPDGADPAAVATVVRTAQALGKTPIVVRDGPGFYTTRVISRMIGEALAVLAEGVEIEAIDRAMTAYGWPVGPLTLSDEVGLEVGQHAGETVSRAIGVEPPPIVRDLVATGFKGKRAGGGFYLYEGKRKRPNPRVYAILGVAPHAPREDVAERLTLAFVNEAVRCLDTGVLRSAAEGDLGAVLGLGFPPFLGGPFRHAAARGTAVRDALRALEAVHGPRFAPAPSIAEGRVGR